MKRWLLATVALIFALSLGAWWTLFYTASGARWALAKFSDLRMARITLEGVEGRLAGPLNIKRVEIESPYAHVVAEDVQTAMQPWSLFLQTVNVAYLRAGRANVLVKRVAGESTQPLRFFTPFFLLYVGDIDVRNASVEYDRGFKQEATRVRARARITSQRLTVDQTLIETTRHTISGRASLMAQRPIPLELSLAIRMPAPQGSDLEFDVAASGHLNRLRVSVESAAPAAARFAGEFTREQNRWRLAGRMESQRFLLDPWLQRPPFTLQQVSLQLEADNESFATSGSLLAPELDRAPLQLQARGRYAERVLALTGFSLRAEQSPVVVTGAGRIDFSEGRPQVNASAQWEHFQWPLRAAANAAILSSERGAASLSGQLPFTIGVHADLRLSDGAPAQLHALGRLTNGRVEFEPLQLLWLDGEITGDAALGFERRDWHIDIRGKDINPAALNAALPGSIAFQVRGAGTGFGRHARFSLTAPTLRGRLRGQPLNGQGSITHDEGGWRFERVAATLGDASFSIAGVWRDKIDLNWSLHAPALQRVYASARGSLHTEGSLRGSQSRPVLATTLQAEKIEYEAWRIGNVSAQASVSFAGERESSLSVASQDVRIGGLKIGSPSFMARMAPLATARVKSAQRRQQWRIDEFCLTWPDQGPNDRGGRICGDALYARDGGWELNALSEEMPLSIFDATFPEHARYGGRWRTQMRVHAPAGRPWTGAAAVQIVDAQLIHQPVVGEEEIVQLGTGSVTINATPATLRASVGLETPGATRIDGVAQLDRREQQPWSQAALRGEVRAHSGDANLLPLMFPNIDQSAGALDVAVQTSGSIDAPAFQGSATLSGGELALYRYNLILRELNVNARLVDNKFVFDGGGRIGDGLLKVDGNFYWRNLDPVGQLHFVGDRLVVYDIPEYRVLASPDVRFVIDGKRIDVSGEVFVPTARLKPSDLRGATRLSPDARLIADATEPPEAEFEIHSDVRVRLGDDVRIDTLGLQGQLGGSVVIATRPNEPPLGRGELTVASGRYDAYGQKLDIARGRLLFSATPLDDPGLDIQAVRQIEERRVGVNVRGTLRAPRMTLFAEPPLPQAQIVAYLLTGKPIDDMSTRDSAAVSAASNELALQGGGLLASQIGRRLGLEEVGVESKSAQETSLVIGKFLSPRLFVSYGISLTESINTLKLRYSISDRWRVKTEAGKDQSTDIEFRIER